jgi:hypothetical protein
MKNKTYHIYISSAAGEIVDNETKRYKFDWSILPEGEYELTFTFQSRYTSISHGGSLDSTYPTMVFATMPFSSNRYKVETNGNANSTQLLGLLRPEDGHKESSQIMRGLSAGSTFNAPIYLYGKPQGNTFEVQLKTHSGNATNVPLYDMVINFKLLCEC